jgi:hypothetical protein
MIDYGCCCNRAKLHAASRSSEKLAAHSMPMVAATLGASTKTFLESAHQERALAHRCLMR